MPKLIDDSISTPADYYSYLLSLMKLSSCEALEMTHGLLPYCSYLNIVMQVFMNIIMH